MAEYTVRKVAGMAGISVRTLHHYDAIGLLKPSARTDANYRLYGEGDLLRLQQILLYREVDIPLAEIKELLGAPGFDLVEALEGHRARLRSRERRLRCVLRTIDRTIDRLTKENEMLSDEDLYEGLSKEQVERYNKEVEEKYDPERVAETNRRLRKLSKAEWEALKAEGGEATVALADLMDRDPADPEVQAIVARHHQWIERFFPASAEVYRGLGQQYAGHPEFRAFYDKVRPNLADFMCEAMTRYADTVLSDET